MEDIRKAGIGTILAIIVLIVVIVLVAIGQLDIKSGALIGTLAAARLL